jgi:hypothetical protein
LFINFLTLNLYYDISILILTFGVAGVFMRTRRRDLVSLGFIMAGNGGRGKSKEL